jgi:hypothetical protein
MAFTYESNKLIPLSIFDLIESFSSFKILIIIEPLAPVTNIPTLITPDRKPIQISDIVNLNFRILQFQLQFKVFILTHESVELIQIKEIQSFLKTIDLSQYKSDKAVLPSEVFIDSSLYSSFSMALKQKAKSNIPPLSIFMNGQLPLQSSPRRKVETKFSFSSPPDLTVEENIPYLSEVIPNFFIGAEKSALNEDLLKNNGITHCKFEWKRITFKI